MLKTPSTERSMMDDHHVWCPELEIADNAYWEGTFPGFGQETYSFGISFKYHEDREIYLVSSFTEPSACLVDEEEYPELEPDELRFYLHDVGWGGLDRIVPSGRAVSYILKQKSSQIQEMLDGHDIEDGTLSDDAIDAANELEAALIAASERDDFWLIEEMQRKPY